MKLATSDIGNATVYVIDTTTSNVWQYNRSGQNWVPLGQPDRDE